MSDAIRRAFDNLYRGNDGKNKTHRQISRAGFEAGWQASAAHLAQQPNTSRDEKLALIEFVGRERKFWGDSNNEILASFEASRKKDA